MKQRLSSGVRFDFTWPLRGLVAAFSLASVAWGADVPATMEGVPGYRVIEPGLAVGGQPTTEAMNAIQSAGFRVVINLRPPSEAVPDEKAVVEAKGLVYVSVPMTPDSMTLSDVRTVLENLGDTKASPVLLHCSSGNRAGGVWGIIQVLRGKSLDDAELDARSAGMASDAMVAAFRRLAAEVAVAESPAPKSER